MRKQEQIKGNAIYVIGIILLWTVVAVMLVNLSIIFFRSGIDFNIGVKIIFLFSPFIILSITIICLGWGMSVNSWAYSQFQKLHQRKYSVQVLTDQAELIKIELIQRMEQSCFDNSKLILALKKGNTKDFKFFLNHYKGSAIGVLLQELIYLQDGAHEIKKEFNCFLRNFQRCANNFYTKIFIPKDCQDLPFDYYGL